MAGTSNVHGGGGPAGEVGFNYIPLIDVTFNLIIFFVLTSTIAVSEPAMALPRPEGDRLSQRAEGNKIVVNVVSTADPGQAAAPAPGQAYYLIRGGRYGVGEYQRVADLLARERSGAGPLPSTGEARGPQVEIRADRRVQYCDVEPVLRASRQAGLPRVSIVALADGR